jgi:hypothetical protein
MRKRIVYAWHALVGGRIGPVGWCGQKGYWWVKPCPCYKPELWGCGWFSGSHGRVISYDEAFAPLDTGDTE